MGTIDFSCEVRAASVEMEDDPRSNKLVLCFVGSSALVLSENQLCRTREQYKKGLLSKNQEGKCYATNYSEHPRHGL